MNDPKYTQLAKRLTKMDGILYAEVVPRDEVPMDPTFRRMVDLYSYIHPQPGEHMNVTVGRHYACRITGDEHHYVFVNIVPAHPSMKSLARSLRRTLKQAKYTVLKKDD